ncbi:alpha/beta fold hydrolase [Croceicoccus sp. Ery15]|uniref:alpha/beta fold hydrolase n=1 Tax=Croceicoccus sp. Ery15 TaxID=1703338 RepID=UPI001E5F5493|nr:alpha/beta hydrolase [Croceicoccus sp. Ery15]
MEFDYREIRAGGLTMRAALLDGGNDAAPPLLMLNGIGFNAELMEPLALALAKPGPDAPLGRSIVIPDMPGCGGSPDSNAHVMMYALSEAVIGMMEALHPGRHFDCIGFSWGGALAQQIAVQASRRVTRLGLVSTTSGLPLAPANPDVIKRLFDPKEYVDPRRLTANFRALLAEGGANATLMQRFRTPTPQGLGNQLLALTGWTAAPMLPFIRVPVALVGVADDAVVPYAHHTMLGCLLPHAQKIELRSGGHLSALARPERVSHALREFLAA